MAFEGLFRRVLCRTFGLKDSKIEIEKINFSSFKKIEKLFKNIFVFSLS